VWLAWRWLLLAEADAAQDAEYGGGVDPAPLLLILDQVRARCCRCV
jgi:hypothetical protein